MIGRWLPPTIAGRVLLAAAGALIVTVATLALLIPLILAGYGSDPDPTATGIGARLISAIVLAAVVGALAAYLLSVALGRAISRPVGDLRELAAAERTATPSWSLPGAPSELRALAAVLHRMAAAATERQTVAEGQRDRLETLLREMADAVLIVDEDDVVRLANPSAERLLGHYGILGRPLVELVRQHEFLEVVARARREGGATGQVERRDPRRSIRVVARRLPGGETLIAAQDLTALRRLETVRTDFVANVSHELRTPIASLKAMAEALEGGAIDDPAAARDFVGRMHREIDELAQLVAELLTLARVESGAEEMRPVPTAPNEIVAGASRFRPLAERAGLSLEISDNDALPDVLADGDRIGQVVSNLIHNAVKFTPPGGRITVGADRRPQEVRFFVQDTGIGLRSDELERVFERFYKGEPSRADEGTGLGLAIARHIVQAHHGTIMAESSGPGHGSVFSFTLPLAAP